MTHHEHRVVVLGGAAYAIGPWALWSLIAAAGVLSAYLALPRVTGKGSSVRAGSP